jgi:hypothetical protein
MPFYSRKTRRMNAEIEILIQQCVDAEPTANPLLDAPIEDTCERAGIPAARFHDLFAHRVATEFLGGKLAFQDADAAINCLHHYCLMGPDQDLLDGLAWEVYRAFDAGEWTHPSERNSVDPISKYTVRLLEKALAGWPWPDEPGGATPAARNRPSR